MPEGPRSMTDLIDEAQKLRDEITQAERAIRAGTKYLTGVKWRYGQVLAAIHAEAKKKGKGAWEKALTAIGDNRQRADENIKIASLFTSVEDAGKCPVRRALKLIRKGAYAAEAERPTDKASVPPTPHVAPERQN